MKVVLSLLLTVAINAVSALAQDFEVPQNPSFRTPQDFLDQEPNAIAAMNWMRETSPKEQTEKRLDVNDFLLKWMSGTKAFSMGLDEKILTFTESSPELLMIFMCGWSQYALETKVPDDPIGGNKHGIDAVIEYYMKFMQASDKDKNVEKYVKMKAEGTLAKYIEKTVRH